MHLVPIDMIDVGQRLRGISEAQVEALMDSIAEVGVLSAISIYRREMVQSGVSVEGYGLVAGAHRVEACRRLGLADIPATVVSLNDLQRQIAECDENLFSTSLTKTERALFTKRRKEAYEALHPETAHGAIGNGRGKSRQVGDSKDDNENNRFTADTAAKTGQSERAVQRDAERGEKIIPEVLELIHGTKLDTGSYLDKLKRLTPNDQVTAARRDLADIRQKERSQRGTANAAKLQADVKARAAREVAGMIAEHIPGEWWDAVKSNLYAAGAKNIGDALTNITGEAIMDRSAA